MLSFREFFEVCSGKWTIERTYHTVRTGEVERSHTEYQVEPLTVADKERILSVANPADAPLTVDMARMAQDETLWPGFAISFATRSETGEEVAMELKALFVPDEFVLSSEAIAQFPEAPTVAQIPDADAGELIRGFYLRDQGYSEAGAIAGRFTYQATRQTLEMTTYYRRSVAVDQMRIVSPTLRLRTIVNYERPTSGEPPSVIDLVGFGLEVKYSN